MPFFAQPQMNLAAGTLNVSDSFFSISLFSLLILVLSIAGAVFSIREAIFSGSTEGLAGFLVSFLVIFGLFASSFWDIARGFIQYYNFRVRRLEDRLYIQYGLLRKVSYTVPVDKIQALKINQTLSARIGTVPAGERASPSGFGLSPLGTVFIRQD